jgi:hypothetical protein
MSSWGFGTDDFLRDSWRIDGEALCFGFQERCETEFASADKYCRG